MRTADEEARIEVLLRVAFALFQFVRQRLLIATPERADRATRRRLEARGWEAEPTVRVVRLRAADYRRQPTDAPGSVEWSCRWLVRGHWRQQPHGPGRRQVRPVWILPHVKGPPDKELRPTPATVFAVVR